MLKTIKPPRIYKPIEYDWKDIARYISGVLETTIHPSYACQVWFGKRQNPEDHKVLVEVMSKK